MREQLPSVMAVWDRLRALRKPASPKPPRTEPAPQNKAGPAPEATGRLGKLLPGRRTRPADPRAPTARPQPRPRQQEAEPAPEAPGRLRQLLQSRRSRPAATPRAPTALPQSRLGQATEEAPALSDRLRRTPQAPPPPPAGPPPAAPARPEVARESKGDTRRLWGREFTVTQQGLSEKQVAAFVEDLLARNKQLAEQGAPGAMVNYAQKLMGELQELEATIRAQAQRDAEVEAVKITANAQRQAQETIHRARGEATAVAQRQADAILTEARKKAEIAESQVRIQAQFMLAKARDQIQAHIQREGEIAYGRLMTSLTALIQEAQRVEGEWKEQTARLWQGDAARLAIGPLGLSSLPILSELPQATPTAPPEAPLAGEGLEAKASPPHREGSAVPVSTPQAVPEQPPPVAWEEPSIEELSEGMEEESPAAEEAPVASAEEQPQATREEAPAAEEAPGASAEELPQATREEAPAAEEAPGASAEELPQATREEAPAAEEAPVASAEELPPTAGEEAPVASGVEQPQATREEAPQPPASESEVDEAAKRSLYAGEIELVVASPVEPALLARLYSKLLAMADIRILRSVGSWESGTTITLLLDRPQPLVGLLLGIPEVRMTPQQDGRGVGGGALSARGARQGPGDRIGITLRG